MRPKIISAADAAALVCDGMTLSIGGGGAGHAVPDRLMEALGDRYRQTGFPRELTIFHVCGLGENDRRGLNHLAQEGLVATCIGGFWGNAPKMGILGMEGKIRGYNFPQGVLSHLVRAMAGGEDGLLTSIGLHTFVDPRYEGGKINAATTDDRVELTTLNGKEYLFYQSIPLDVVFIRGSAVDKEGNLTMEEEVGTFSMLSLAQAVKSNGGIVIAQVKKINSTQSAVPVQVKVPAVLIDYVVEVPDQTMTFITDYEEAFIRRDAPFTQNELRLEGIKKIIARRAAMELPQNGLVNLGYGMPDGVSTVAKQEGVDKNIVLMIEQGQTDGVITTGLNFGAMYNPAAITDEGYQFDFFHGGGLDICYLGFAQVDAMGNVNSSRFGRVHTGCGGFIDISQNTKKIVFCGTFAAKADIEVNENGLNVKDPGAIKKFIKKVEQVTFNGQYAMERGKEVFYCTERALFKLTPEGLKMVEIAPGIDLEKDILAMMEFTPQVDEAMKTMDSRIFKTGKMGLVLKGE